MENLESTKRLMQLTRLELAKLSDHLGKDPWTIMTNAAYEQCQSPSVTVVITLFNYAQYIHQCLDSVAESIDLPSGFDVIVIDDHSNDESVSLVEAYLRRSQMPICLVKKIFNTGLADARNTGLRLARSPFVFILDADNWIYPNCLATLYNAMLQSGSAGAYGIISRFNNLTGEGIDIVSCFEWDEEMLVEGPYIDAMAMFKKDILLSLGGYSAELMEVGWCGWEDYDMYLKLAQAGHSCKFVPQILSGYRCHPGSMINVAAKYTPLLVKYFYKKFSRLVDKYPHLNTVFYFPRETPSVTPPVK